MATFIPDEVIDTNILPRLPVKTLIRFKSVSKTLYSLISDPQFNKSRLEFSSSSTHHFLLKSSKSLYTLAYTQPNTLKQLVKLPYQWDYNTKVIGCCNGLICLYDIQNTIHKYEYNKYFIVWNPATFQHRKICTPFHYPTGLVLCKCGFGHVPLFDDYKIICSFFNVNVLHVLHVFSLRTGKWKTIDLPSDYTFFGFRSTSNNDEGIHLDGTLYWDVTKEDELYICSFSLLDEQVNQEKLFLVPESSIKVGENTKLCVFQGCLSIICPLYDKYDVYVRNQQGDLSSWEKLFTIPRIRNFVNVEFAITGKCLLVHNQWKEVLKLVAPSAEDFEHSQGIRYEHLYVGSVHHYVESLVSPFTLM